MLATCSPAFPTCGRHSPTKESQPGSQVFCYWWQHFSPNHYQPHPAYMETRRFSLRNLGRSLRDRPLPFRYLPLNRSDNLNIRLKNPRKYLWIATTIVLTFVALFSVFKITSPTRLKQNLQIVASAAVTARLFDNVPPTLWPMRWPDSRFAYAMYATNQQYLCNTVNPFLLFLV